MGNRGEGDGLVQQISTYDRCFATDKRHSFAFIDFNYRIFVFAFHRSGLFSSGPISHRTPVEFQYGIWLESCRFLARRPSVWIGLASGTRIVSMDVRTRSPVQYTSQRYCTRPCNSDVRPNVWTRLFYSPTLALHVVHLVCTTGAQDTPVNLRSRTLALVERVTELSEQMSYQSRGTVRKA